MQVTACARSGTARTSATRSATTGRWWRWRARSSRTACPARDNLRGGPRDRADGTGRRRRAGHHRHGRRPAGRRPGRRRDRRAWPPPTTWPSSPSATSPWPPPPGADGATTVASTGARRRRGRHRRLRHRRAGRRAPRGRRRPSTSRPTWPRWPGRRSPWSAPGSSRSSTSARRWSGWRRSASPSSGYRTRRFPGFYLTDSGFDLDWRWTRPEQVADGDARPGRRQGVHAGRAGGGQPAAGRRAARPGSCTTGCWPRAWPAWRATAITGKAVTPFLLAHFHARTDGAEPGRSTSGSSCATPRWPRGSPPPTRRRPRRQRSAVTRPSRVLVVGDLVTDVLAVHVGPLAAGSDTAARITRRPAAGRPPTPPPGWPHLGVRVTLVAAVGADDAGRRPARRAARGRRALRAVRRTAGPPTGSVVVLADDGERTMLTDRGANLLLRPCRCGRRAGRRPDAGGTCTCPATRCWTSDPRRPGGTRWRRPASAG